MTFFSLRARLLACVVLLCVAFAPAMAGSPSEPAMAGQMITSQIPGGQQTREYARNGRLVYEVIERQKLVGSSHALEAVEREWLDDGTPMRDQTFLAGKEIQATFWYMNGKVKEKRTDQSIRKPGGIAGTYVEHFSDLGVLQASGVYQGQSRPVGVHREYDEQGRLKRELTYSPDGVKLSEKALDAEGAEKSAASYFPDGSRKIDNGSP
ncbi:toxin-antitoxin system YwqK family antitoxin [Bordetella sp. BOR01]|uniref:toxin-antitoxin system YwqK family antitoxin n=1 Tax=Bordetella sp. BOR01 TaxID=2854779 RepID=UPI001C45D90D|nr:hypothetical protein [Bordetella sp. BOR01]MBV7483198.1 hypothetical protein [Bordetella sp. BOR01]